MRLHLPTTTIESSVLIGTGADGSPLRRWTEENGTRAFEERYVYFISSSGQRFGAVSVVELVVAAG